MSGVCPDGGGPPIQMLIELADFPKKTLSHCNTESPESDGITLTHSNFVTLCRIPVYQGFAGFGPTFIKMETCYNWSQQLTALQHGSNG